MYGKFRELLQAELAAIRQQGLYKEERILEGPQGAEIQVGGKTVLNFCANNYLGLAADPRVTEAARRTLDRWGYGLSSVRFICGTTSLHKQLEQELSEFLGGRLARYKIPKEFRVVDVLPRTPYGKVVKGELVEQWKKEQK